MPLGVVHAFEMVQVKEDHGEVSLVPGGLLCFFLYLGVELAAVGNAGKLVRVGQPVHGLALDFN